MTSNAIDYDAPFSSVSAARNMFGNQKRQPKKPMKRSPNRSPQNSPNKSPKPPPPAKPSAPQKHDTSAAAPPKPKAKSAAINYEKPFSSVSAAAALFANIDVKKTLSSKSWEKSRKKSPQSDAKPTMEQPKNVSPPSDRNTLKTGSPKKDQNGTMSLQMSKTSPSIPSNLNKKYQYPKKEKRQWRKKSSDSDAPPPPPAPPSSKDDTTLKRFERSKPNRPASPGLRPKAQTHHATDARSRFTRKKNSAKDLALESDNTDNDVPTTKTAEIVAGNNANLKMKFQQNMSQNQAKPPPVSRRVRDDSRAKSPKASPGPKSRAKSPKANVPKTAPASHILDNSNSGDKFNFQFKNRNRKSSEGSGGGSPRAANKELFNRWNKKATNKKAEPAKTSGNKWKHNANRRKSAKISALSKNINLGGFKVGAMKRVSDIKAERLGLDASVIAETEPEMDQSVMLNRVTASSGKKKRRRKRKSKTFQMDEMAGIDEEPAAASMFAQPIVALEEVPENVPVMQSHESDVPDPPPPPVEEDVRVYSPRMIKHSGVKLPVNDEMSRLLEKAENQSKKKKKKKVAQVKYSSPKQPINSNTAIFNSLDIMSKNKNKSKVNKPVDISKYPMSPEIMKLRKEVQQMEQALKVKKNQLAKMEKDYLENSIAHMKPVSLIKRLNSFVIQADNKQLDIIQSVLMPSQNS